MAAPAAAVPERLTEDVLSLLPPPLPPQPANEANIHATNNFFFIVPP